MAQKIIPCGGWYVDENTLSFDENKVLSVVGGGGEAGVTSFNGRAGVVVPQNGDYTAEQVGAVSLSGGTMTGNLILNGDPTNNLQAATKQYVDVLGDTVNDIIDGTESLPYLPDNGGTLTGALNMGNNKITMGATPTATTDVTNKGYVDGVVKVVSDEVDGILAGTTPITLPIASDTHIGGIKVGTGLSITEDGTLNVAQQQQQIPTASELTLGAVKVGTGLHIEDDGTLEATAGLYRDPAAGVAFVGPNESKTIMLQKAYQVLYIGYMYISSTVVDPIATTPIYLNAGQNMTDQSSSHLTVSFDENGASFSATNLDSTIGIFMFYGGFQEKIS